MKAQIVLVSLLALVSVNMAVIEIGSGSGLWRSAMNKLRSKFPNTANALSGNSNDNQNSYANGQMSSLSTLTNQLPGLSTLTGQMSGLSGLAGQMPGYANSQMTSLNQGLNRQAHSLLGQGQNQLNQVNDATNELLGSRFANTIRSVTGSSYFPNSIGAVGEFMNNFQTDLLNIRENSATIDTNRYPAQNLNAIRSAYQQITSNLPKLRESFSEFISNIPTLNSVMSLPSIISQNLRNSASDVYNGFSKLYSLGVPVSTLLPETIPSMGRIFVALYHDVSMNPMILLNGLNSLFYRGMGMFGLSGNTNQMSAGFNF